MTGVVIRTRLDALIWDAVDRCWQAREAGVDPSVANRVAAREIELALYRAQAARFLEHDWLVDVLHETDVRATSAAAEELRAA